MQKQKAVNYSWEDISASTKRRKQKKKRLFLKKQKKKAKGKRLIILKNKIDNGGADNARQRMIQRQKENHKNIFGAQAQIERVEAREFARMGDKAEIYFREKEKTKK